MENNFWLFHYVKGKLIIFFYGFASNWTKTNMIKYERKCTIQLTEFHEAEIDKRKF